MYGKDSPNDYCEVTWKMLDDFVGVLSVQAANEFDDPRPFLSVFGARERCSAKGLG
jgi:hypothetical protein